MTAIPFDAFTFTQTLVDAGLPEKQATAVTRAFSGAIQESNANVVESIRRDELATKGDIKDLELKIRDTELRIITELSKMQLQIQNTQTTNRIVLAGVIAILSLMAKQVFWS